MTPLSSTPSSDALEADPGFVAFRYVAGELTDAEAAAFEERLAADQAAREAVARAVEIAQAVTVLGPQLATQALPVGRSRRGADCRTHSRGPRSAAFVTVIVAAAACVALAVAFNPFNGSQPADDGQVENVESNDPHDRTSPRQNAARLVELWSDTDGLLVADASALETLSSTWSDESGTSENGDSEFAWMMAAVSAELPESDSDAPALPQHPLSPQTREN